MKIYGTLMVLALVVILLFGCTQSSGYSQGNGAPKVDAANPSPSGKEPGSTAPPTRNAQGGATTPPPATTPPSGSGSGDTTTPPAGGGTAPPPAQGQVKEFSVEAKQWEFIPGTITVNKGDTVKLKLKSTDVVHGFLLPDFGINKRLDPGQEVEVSFTADKTGSFTFYCNVPCGPGHRDMKGTFVVN